MFRDLMQELMEKRVLSCPQVNIGQIVKFTIRKGNKTVNMTGKAKSNSNSKSGALDVTSNGKKYLLLWVNNNKGWTASK